MEAGFASLQRAVFPGRGVIRLASLAPLPSSLRRQQINLVLDPHPFLDRRVGIGFEDAFDMTQVDVEGAGIEAGDFVGDGERLALRFVRFRFLGGQDQDLAGQRNDFIKQVNASIVDPGFIASVRRKLALRKRQDQAASGIGEIAQGARPSPRSA